MIFFVNDPAPTAIYTLSLHDALPISPRRRRTGRRCRSGPRAWTATAASSEAVLKLLGISCFYHDAAACLVEDRSEEHTSELQSQSNLVCRLLLEKKKNT